MKKHQPDIFSGIVAGLAGGLLASFMMEQFQALWSKVLQSEGKSDNHKQEKPATVKAADAISEQVTGRKVPKTQRAAAGEAVHYAMGMSSAAVYGGLAEFAPLITAGKGIVFGTGVWLLADEVSVSALGLSKTPAKMPLSTHAYALVSHFVYGWITETVRDAVRRVL